MLVSIIDAGNKLFKLCITCKTLLLKSLYLNLNSLIKFGYGSDISNSDKSPTDVLNTLKYGALFNPIAK